MGREVITVVNTAISSVRNKCSLYLMYQKKKKKINLLNASDNIGSTSIS